MKLSDINKIKHGDYLEFRRFDSPDLSYGRVIHISDPDLVYLDRKIIWIPIHPLLDISNKITWDIDYLTKYVNRIIDSPTEKRMIKLLYDR